MTETAIGLAGIAGLLLALFLLGAPVGFAMAIVGFLGYAAISSFDTAAHMTGQTLWTTFSMYGLTVIPLFTLMGQVVFYSGVNEKLYAAAYNWIGHIRGGLAMATIAACSAFATICGSNTATAATMSTVALPQMKKFNYNPKLSAGAVASGSTLGVVIPPSVVLIIIGLSTEQSIEKLFYGGIGAGGLLTLMLVGTVYLICTLCPSWGPVGPKASWKARFTSLLESYETFLLFALVILGLFLGYFTAAEAGAAGAFLAIVLGFVQRKLTWSNFLNALRDTLKASCMVITIVAGAMIFGKFLTKTGIPHQIAETVGSMPVSKTVILLMIFGIYAIGGTIMDALALLIVTLPIFYPLVVDQLGYDPLWFGVTITVITTLGAITPPVGATTFVVAGSARDIPMKDVFKGVSLFIPAYVISIGLYMLFPKIITWLPSLLR
jgi:tripartite ATP-independent transporter DctM subunit